MRNLEKNDDSKKVLAREANLEVGSKLKELIVYEIKDLCNYVAKQDVEKLVNVNCQREITAESMEGKTCVEASTDFPRVSYISVSNKCNRCRQYPRGSLFRLCPHGQSCYCCRGHKTEGVTSSHLLDKQSHNLLQTKDH